MADHKTVSICADVRGSRWYMGCLSLGWMIAVALSLSWNLYQDRQWILEAARVTARTALERDVLYRRWNASHGGVYVPVTRETPANEYLSHIPDRDIITSTGRRLTLMNPAYMTRQVHELARQIGVYGHLTSLNPLRPENAADLWEARVLRAFETGITEVSSIETLSGRSHMRLMRPQVVEQACLECHGDQGYEVGDIRGGLSVAVPMMDLEAGGSRVLSQIAGHAMLGLLGLLGIVLGARRLETAQRRQRRSEVLHLAEREQRAADRVDVLAAAAAGAAHEISQPLTSLIGTSELLQAETGPEDPVRRKLGTIVADADRIARIVENMKSIQSYHTHRYAGGGQIVSFVASSDAETEDRPGPEG